MLNNETELRVDMKAILYINSLNTGFTGAAIIFIIFWDFLMFYQIFLSPQVKPCAIITYKHDIYQLPHESPNDLRLKILGNKKISGKCLNFIEW